MKEDIRDKEYIKHEDIIKLNFIKNPSQYLFRRHYRQGLRSHVVEILKIDDVEKEKNGVIDNKIRIFPRAEPVNILRIFKKKFYLKKSVLDEIKKLKILEKYISSKNLAKSQEFIVDYSIFHKGNFLLCGLQEFVKGEILDIWKISGPDRLLEIYDNMKQNPRYKIKVDTKLLVKRLQHNTKKFIDEIKKLILIERYIPDLAGIGNLYLTINGDIKLVDINNVSKVSFDNTIFLDDKGYPVCDKSVEIISLLEKNILGKSIDMREKLYATFLCPSRTKDVKVLDDNFYFS